jgi:hypothetical protein
MSSTSGAAGWSKTKAPQIAVVGAPPPAVTDLLVAVADHPGVVKLGEVQRIGAGIASQHVSLAVGDQAEVPAAKPRRARAGHLEQGLT